MQIHLSPARPAPETYGARQRAVIDPEKAERAKRELAAWPVYRPTPLVSLPGFAQRAGVGAVWVKNEAERGPLSSFKALGGAFALGEALRDAIAVDTGTRPDYDALFAGRHRDAAAAVHAVAATDGNHGRSLAWGAQLFGARCTIFLPRNVSAERAALIAEFGATIERVDGNYDRAVAVARDAATRPGHVLIQDTSFEGYTLHCQRIMYGYMLMAEEIRGQLPAGELPTHVILQVGCGGLAASVAADFWLHWGARRPKLVAVQSTQADTLRPSLAAGERRVVDGELDTAMVGIACGELSMLAWDLLRDEVAAAVAIDDEPAFEAMRLLAVGVDGDPPLVVGETGAAGFGALLQLTRHRVEAAGLGLDAESRVLLIASEGALDARSYEKVMKLAA